MNNKDIECRGHRPLKNLSITIGAFCQGSCQLSSRRINYIAKVNLSFFELRILLDIKSMYLTLSSVFSWFLLRPWHLYLCLLFTPQHAFHQHYKLPTLYSHSPFPSLKSWHTFVFICKSRFLTCTLFYTLSIRLMILSCLNSNSFFRKSECIVYLFIHTERFWWAAN